MKGWSCPSKKYLDNIEQAAIGLSAYSKSNLFRPPYGRIRKEQATELLALGYQIIMWDILTYDYDKTLDIKSCIDAISRKTRNGSIVVFHDSLKSRNQTNQILALFAHLTFVLKLLKQPVLLKHKVISLKIKSC